MRDFMLDVAVPTVGYFVAVALCIGLVCFTAGVGIELISNPIGVVWEDRTMNALIAWMVLQFPIGFMVCKVLKRARQRTFAASAMPTRREVKQ
jgi:hypothetical protein